MNRPLHIRRVTGLMLVGCGMFLAASLMQTSQVMAQSEQKPSVATGPAWLYDERKIGQEGWTELMDASQKGDVAKVEALLTAGRKVEETDEHGVTPLFAAALGGHVKVMELLVAKGANVNARVADSGNLEVLQLLFSKSINVNDHNQNGGTALIYAAESGKGEAVEFLLQAGASTQLKAKYNLTALYVAAQNGHHRVVSQLLDRGMDVNDRGYQSTTALFTAAENGRTEVVRVLLDRGADPNIADEMKMTPLLRASSIGHEAIVRFLLDHGADPNIGSEFLESTPLLSAVWYGHAGIVKALVEKGAKIERIGSSLSPLQKAAAQNAAATGNTDTLKMLLISNYLFNISTLRAAAQVGNAEKVKLLLQRGADPNERDGPLMTPLMVAALNGHVEALDLLLAHGADIKAKDRDEQLSATEHALLGKDRLEEKLARYEEEDKRAILDRYSEVVPHLVEAEKARRSLRGITPRLVFVTKTGGCSLSTLDPMTGVTTPWRTLKTCPEDMFVSDQPGAVILRTRNKLEVYQSGTSATEAVKAIALPDPDKKGWKLLFQIAGQLADGRLAVGYREQDRNGKHLEAKWTLYAYSQGKWDSVEDKNCVTSSWCLMTPFSGRSVKKNLGDEDWLWHPYVRLNLFFTEAGDAEMDSAGKFTKLPSTAHHAYGYHYIKMTVEGKEHLLYYHQSAGPIYRTGEQRYQTGGVYLERSGAASLRLSEEFNMGTLEGKFLLWTEYPQLRLLDIDTGVEPLQGLHLAAWAYWAMVEGNGSQVAMPSGSGPQTRP